MKLISFDLKADMGFFKKPDINDKIYLTYNMLHKPALLGILGAIAGLRGFEKNGELPEYYRKLKHLKMGIEPLDSNNGNFNKTTISYNNTTGFASGEEGGNLIVTEQVLIKPSFRCYLLLNLDNTIEQLLYNRIHAQEAEYLPYLGKNDFSVWWEKGSVLEHDFVDLDFSSDFYISTVFMKEEAIINHLVQLIGREARSELGNRFLYFEQLPIGFNEHLYQYDMADFVFSNARFKKEMRFESNACFYKLSTSEKAIQLF